ncbi:MAG: antitoxin ParD1/3/4 [Verrucomicrobiales bacterium]|jgi:antitoxin ParD1/3/4
MGKPTSNVSLTPELVAFVQEQVSTGNFGSSSEVHRAALAALKKSEEERQAKIDRLRAEIQIGIDGIDAGRFTEINTDEEQSAFIAKCRGEATRRVKSRGVKIAP